MTKMRKDILKSELLNMAGILPVWHDKTFDDFTNDEGAKSRVLKYLEQCEKSLANGYGIFLFGKNGVGKTHLMMCLLKSLLEERYKVRSISLGTLIKLYTQEYWHNDDNYYSQVVKMPHFLEIEEIGKEYKSGENDLGRLVLDSTVRFRLQLKKPILFTTNLIPSEIETMYTHDVASMLFECAVPIKVRGEDFRETKKYNSMRDDLGI